MRCLSCRGSGGEIRSVSRGCGLQTLRGWGPTPVRKRSVLIAPGFGLLGGFLLLMLVNKAR